MRTMHSLGVPSRRLIPAVFLATFAWGQATGDVALQLEIAAVDGAGWRAEGIGLALRHDASGRLHADVSVTRLALPPPIGTRDDLRGECRDLVITPRRFTCNDLVIDIAGTPPDGLRLAGRLEYGRTTGALGWALELPADGSGKLQVDGDFAAGAWSVDVTAVDWRFDAFARLGRFLGLAVPQIAGVLDMSLVARGEDGELAGLVFELLASGVTGGNEPGTIAAEGLRVELRGSAWPRDERLAFDVRGALASGEAYVEPVYIELAAHPVRIVARGLADAHGITLNQVIFDQHATVHADASAELERSPDNDWRLVEAQVRVPRAELPGAYAVLLQPFLAGTAFAELDTSGALSGELAWRNGALEGVWLDMAEVNFDDQEARLAIYGLSGDLGWVRAGSGAPAPPLNLRWSGGFVYGIPFGEAEARFDAPPGRWVLAQPVSIPLLEGALEIDRFEFGDFTAGNHTLLFDARLLPVSMRELSRALDWPPLSGRLSGTLPQLSHAEGIVSLGGELTAEVFDGIVSIRDLRIQRPLQPRARLQAEIELRGLELAEVTEAMSFGLMTGRLDGYVHGLDMIDWVPVAFDARLQTPADDRSRKRISQRAVDNIASIGGGGAGGLSTGFLRFFEDFSYDAFALGCRLEGDVCEMSGLEPGEQGYVILRGRGLPRIDVIGFARRVSWSALVEQLEAIIESEGPEVR
ncbi:MAG TPA: hypothetical protein VMQ83_07890 [Gammaproteobacteria bacterium]|nr:hypothetical protein [Gammaproteobacteria bacterium]